VTRKCNVLIIINNKVHHWLQDTQGQELEGDMIPKERGLEGPCHFYHILFTHNFLMERSGYMSFLGDAMWFLIACKYLNPSLGCFGGSSGSSSLTLFIHYSLVHALHYVHIFHSFILVAGMVPWDLIMEEESIIVGCSSDSRVPNMNQFLRV
jgi:hypothetical protein